jgi:hypothetical protein
MSVSTEVIVRCNGRSPQCEGRIHLADSANLSATAQRKLAYRTLGWHQIEAKDFCPACWQHRKKRG